MPMSCAILRTLDPNLSCCPGMCVFREEPQGSRVSCGCCVITLWTTWMQMAPDIFLGMISLSTSRNSDVSDTWDANGKDAWDGRCGYEANVCRQYSTIIWAKRWEMVRLWNRNVSSIYIYISYIIIFIMAIRHHYHGPLKMGHAEFTDPGRVDPGRWLQENLEEDEGTLNAEDIELLREVTIGGVEVCGASPSRNFGILVWINTY